MNPEVLRFRTRLDVLYKRAEELEEMELQSHWARYLCVLTSGFLESSIQAIYGRYAIDKSAPHVANFVQQRLRYFQNAKMGNICSLAGEFNPEWGEQLGDIDEELKDAVNSVVANRHLIAHGRDVGISFARMKEYYPRIRRVVEIIQDQCDA